MSSNGQPVITSGPEGDLSTLQTPYPAAPTSGSQGSGGSSGGDPHLTGMGTNGGQSGGLPNAPWVPTSTPVKPLAGPATGAGGFTAGDDWATIPKNWTWILGQLQWAYQQFGAIQINPSWFSDNSKDRGDLAGVPALSDAYRYDGLYGLQAGNSQSGDGLYATSTSGQSMTSQSTTSRSLAAEGCYIYVPQLPDYTQLPAVWPKMSAGDKQAFIDKQVNHSNTYGSASLDNFYNQTWAPIEQLFQAAISYADHLEQGTTATFTKGYGPQDSEVETSWHQSQGSLQQLEGSILQQQDNRLATQMDTQSRLLAQATMPPGPNG